MAMGEYIAKSVAIARLTALEIGDPCATMTDAKRTLADTHSADVAPVVHARWVMRGGKFRCSICDAKANWVDEGGSGGFSHDYVQLRSPWCHNCGAKMDGEI